MEVTDCAFSLQSALQAIQQNCYVDRMRNVPRAEVLAFEPGGFWSPVTEVDVELKSCSMYEWPGCLLISTLKKADLISRSLQLSTSPRARKEASSDVMPPCP